MTQEKKTKFVQFAHPGGEAKPDPGSDYFIGWNKKANGKGSWVVCLAFLF